MALFDERSPLEILADPMSDRTAVRDAYAFLMGRPDMATRLAELGVAILGDGETLSAAECRARLHAYIEAELDGRDTAAEEPLVAALIEKDPLRAEEHRLLLDGLRGLREESLPEPDEYPVFDVSFARDPAAIGVRPIQGVFAVVARVWSRSAALFKARGPAGGDEAGIDDSESAAGSSESSRFGRRRSPIGPPASRNQMLAEILIPVAALAILALLLFRLPRSTAPLSAADATATAQAATEQAGEGSLEIDQESVPGGTPLGPPRPVLGGADATAPASSTPRATSQSTFGSPTSTLTPVDLNGTESEEPRAPIGPPRASTATPFPTLEAYPGPDDPLPTLEAYPGPDDPPTAGPSTATIPAPTDTSEPGAPTGTPSAAHTYSRRGANLDADGRSECRDSADRCAEMAPDDAPAKLPCELSVVARNGGNLAPPRRSVTLAQRVGRSDVANSAL